LQVYKFYGVKDFCYSAYFWDDLSISFSNIAFIHFILIYHLIYKRKENH